MEEAKEKQKEYTMKAEDRRNNVCFQRWRSARWTEMQHERLGVHTVDHPNPLLEGQVQERICYGAMLIRNLKVT